ncbi:MAG: hypothetical protein LAO24_00225 [Acidobacteriia bacterium]|nr:hypothetical protein [Terriglobia bacterium]
MKKWTLRIGAGILAIFVIAGLAYHFGLRNWCLHWGTTATEAHATLPGDDLFPVYNGEATHAITIHTSPQKIWPWLMQIGQDRGGFYSYTFLENAIGADMPKVERLVPDWKPRAVGETVWFGNPQHFEGQARMVAAVVEPERAFVMVMPNDWQKLQSGQRAQDALWSFTLQALENGQSRLIVRVRGGEPPTLRARIAGRLFWEPAHFVMEQKMLRTIRDLAERV